MIWSCRDFKYSVPLSSLAHSESMGLDSDLWFQWRAPVETQNMWLPRCFLSEHSGLEQWDLQAGGQRPEGEGGVTLHRRTSVSFQGPHSTVEGRTSKGLPLRGCDFLVFVGIFSFFLLNLWFPYIATFRLPSLKMSPKRDAGETDIRVSQSSPC